MSYIGTEPKDIRSFGRTKFDYTATQGQTAFTGADDDGKVLNFTVGQIEVYVNGILMDDSDFTTTGTGTVTLATAANLNDVINIVSFETNIPDSNYVPASGGTFTGDVDFGANKITYANVYAQLSDLPSASTYHGMFAHVHATGLAYYAHAGAWIPLANTTGATFTGGVNVSNNHVNIDSGYSYQWGDSHERIEQSDATIEFFTNNSQNMTLSGGNLGIATTENVSLATTEEGFWYQANDWMAISRASGPVAYFNRLTSDGTIVMFRKNGSNVGSMGSINGQYLYIGQPSNVGMGFISANVRPTTDGTNADNTYDFGHPSVRWDDIFATNGTINTSDENEKQNITSLTSAEITAATAISKLFKTYKWKDKVAAKGNDARTHTGVVAQQVQTAMSNAGLDASKYAFWCSDTWWEKGTDVYDTKDEAPEGATERTRMGIRYPELLSFVSAATEQRLTNIETRLAALEGG